MTAYPPTTPPVEASRPPPFHDWNENPKRFERMAMSLLAADLRILDADLFSLSGTKQYGVDAVGRLRDSDAIIVQSSKCYVQTDAKTLVDWSDEFLKEWAYWKDRKVSGFILATAATNITALALESQIAIERARFEALGLTYDVWGPEALTRRLGQSRSTTQRFLGEVWANLLNGPAPTDAPDSADDLGLALSNLSEMVAARLEDGVAHLRSHALDKVEAILALAQGAAWSQLTDPVKGAVLRLAGDLANTRGDTAGAEEASLAALALDPDDKRLAATLAALTGGPQRGLEVLGAPRDRRGRQRQAAFHLELGYPKDAEAVLAILMAEQPDDAEDVRLMSYARLAQNDRAGGLALALRAEHLAPHWPRIVDLVARARYMAGFSPSAPTQLLLDRLVVPWVLVKTDDVSLELRRQAADGFARLAKLTGSEPLIGLAQLACLACLPDAQATAAELGAQLLVEHPDDAAVLEWVLARSYPIDVSPSRAALIATLRAGTASTHQVGILAEMLWRLEGEAAGLAVLRDALGVLEGEPLAEAEEWIERLSQSAAGTPQVSAAEDINLAFARAEADDYDQLSARLRDRLERDVPLYDGFSLAVLASERGWWSALAPHVEALARFETAHALRLAAFVLHHTARPQAVLDFIELHGVGRPGDRWPRSMRRIEIAALSQLGRWPQAIKIAQALVNGANRADDRKLLAHLLGSAGDAKSCVPVVRRLLKDKALNAEEALRYSKALTREDRSLARELWFEGDRQGFPDALVMPALGQGYKLGLDRELGTLTRRVHERAEAGADDVQAFRTDDLPEMLRQRREHVGRIRDQLSSGAVPVHMAATALGEPLARLYQFIPSGSPRAPQRPVFLRHGARETASVTAPWPSWTLFLDPTALLVADQLDLLDLVEGLDQPLMVSRRVIDALYNLERDVTHQQVSRVEAGEAIIAALKAGALRLVSSDFTEQETVRHDSDRIAVSQPGPTLRSVRATLEALGDIAATPDPSWEPTAMVRLPVARDRLVFIENTLESATIAGQLEALLRRFECELPAESLAYIEAEIAAAKAGDAFGDRLRGLRERIAAGLISGAYIHPPGVTADGEEEDEVDGARLSPLELCLFDLIAAPTMPNGMVWIDDRYVTGFPEANGNRIVGVVEVLNALVAAGRLTPEARRERFLKLRAGGAVFIALSMEELSEPLLAAPIIDEDLVETPSLAILRRNLAVALRLDPWLKIGEASYESLLRQPDEFVFLNGARRLAINALDAIWRRPGASIVDCRARADWIWSALRMDRCVRDLPGDDAGYGNQMFAALLVAGVLALPASWVIDGKLKATEKRQAEYLDWAVATILAPREGRDEAFLDLVAAQLRDLLVAPFEEEDLDEGLRAVVVHLRQEVLQRLPRPLRQRVIADETFAAQVGVSSIITLTFGAETFHNSVFWRAGARALRSGQAWVTDDKGKRWRLTRVDDDLVLHTTQLARLRQSFFAVLVQPAKQRRKAALSHLESLNLAPADRDAFRDRISDARDEGDLAHLFYEAALTSAEDYYDRMLNAYEDGNPHPVSLFMPPRADRLLHALRLGAADRPFADRVFAAWTRLASEENDLAAFTALAGLPVDLAALLVDRAIDLSDVVAPSSPMAMLHMAAFHQRQGADATPILEALAEETAGQTWLFVALLAWSLKAFQDDTTWWALAVEDRLAVVWTHAHRLTAMIGARGKAARSTAEIFYEQMPIRSLGAAFAEPKGLVSDCAFPAILQPPALLCHGLAYVFGDTEVWPVLSEALQGKLASIFIETDDEKIKPSTGFLTRTVLAGNALGSWLSTWPKGLLGGELDPESFRERQLDKVIGEIELEPTDWAAWRVLGTFGRPAVSESLRDRLDRVFSDLDLWSLHERRGLEGLKAMSHVLGARLRLGGPLAEGQLLGKLHRLATSAARAHPGEIRLGDGAATDSRAARAKICEAVVASLGEAALSESPNDALEAFHNAVMAVAHGWPLAAPFLRDLVDRFLRQSRPDEMGPLWRAFVALRQWA